MLDRMTGAAVFALLLCGPALADDRADIEAQLSAWEQAYNGGDAAGVSAIYAEDAKVLPPGGPIVEGAEAITGVWQGAMDSGLKDVDLQPIDIEVNGDMAVETGTFQGMAGDAPSKGKYVAVWKKVDGTWLMHRDIWNEMPAE